MARGLQVGEWVDRVNDDDKVIATGFTKENLGNGFWEVQFIDSTLNYIDTVRSNRLRRCESSLFKADGVIIERLFNKLENEFRHEAINKAIDAKDYDTLKNLYNQ